MASYGGYTTSGFGGGGVGTDGGGFLGGSQLGSQGGQGGKNYTDESVRPVTIRQLLNCDEAFPDADLMIDNHSIKTVTIVGQVRSVHPQATNTTYRLDDGTGTLDVKLWIDAEKAALAEEGGDTGVNVREDMYVRAWGRLKSFNGKKHLGAHFIRPIEDFDEVNYHLLEATYVHLFFTRVGLHGGDLEMTDAGANKDDLFVGGGGDGSTDARIQNCSAVAKKVYTFLEGTPGGNEGVHMDVIRRGTGLGQRDLENALQELNNSGTIYQTVDDFTFAILETY